MQKITVDMYADVLCGWAYIAHRRVAEAVRPLGQVVEVRWRPFLIDPSAPRPSAPLKEVLRDPGVQGELERCTPVGQSSQSRRSEISDLAASLGIGPVWQPRWRASSWGAQRLVVSAGLVRPEAQWAVTEELMHAHFVEGRDVARLDVLGPIAQRHSLPEPAAARSGTYALAYLEPGVDPDEPVERATREQLLEGQALGVRTSPTFLHGDRVVAVGAQPPDILAQAFTGLADGPAVPAEVRRLRLARGLLEARNPLGCLYLLAPLQDEHAGDRGLALLTARALLAAASLGAARDTLAELLQDYPDDPQLHLLMAEALRRSGDRLGATRHLRLGGTVA